METVQIALGFITAAAFSLAIVPLLLKLSVVYGLYDVPDATSPLVVGQYQPRKLHVAPIPRLGGIAIFLGFVMTTMIWPSASPLKVPILISGIIFALGLVDDLYPLPAGLRLFIQCVCAYATVHICQLGLREIALTPSTYFALPAFAGEMVAVFIVVGAINSVNMIDGLDGLAGGVVIIGITMLSFLYFVRIQDVHLLLYVTVPVLGSLLGFLKYNTYPATIFMGDSGSNWLGYMTGLLLLIVLNNLRLEEINHQLVLNRIPEVSGSYHIPLISAVLCLAIPVFDTAFVMISRMRDGLSPMSPDRRHFHHTLLKLGLSHSQSVSAVYFVALAAAVLGILPVVFYQYNFAWLPYAEVAALLLIIPMRVHPSKAAIARISSRKLLIRSHWAIRGQVDALIRYWERANRYVLYALLLAAPAFSGASSLELGYMAAAAALFIVIVSLFQRGQHSDFFDSIAISLGALVLLTSNNLNAMTIELSGTRMSIQYIYNDLFIFLFLSTVILFFTTIKRRYFIFTPSDFLLLTIPMIMLLVPEPYKSHYHLDIISLRSMVVFLCLRTMVKRRMQNIYHVKIITLAALAFVALSGIWQMRIVY